MKYRLYTRSHASDLIRELESDRVFTAEEHALVSERDQAHFKTKDTLLAWYESTNGAKHPAVEFTADVVRKKNARLVLSLGSGEGVMEYWLKQLLPTVHIVATDFDAFFMRKANELFPEITSLKFDFFNDSISSLVSTLKSPPDLVVFYGSAYVMNDSQFTHLFKQLKQAGVKTLIDFCPASITWPRLSRLMLGAFKSRVQKWVRPDPDLASKFHGYARTPDEWRRLYVASGWRIVQETMIGPYPQVTVCE